MENNTFYLLLTIYGVVGVIAAIVYAAIKTAKDKNSDPWEITPIAFLVGLFWPLAVAMGCIYAPFFFTCLLTKYIMKKKEERKERNNRKEVCRTI